MPIYPVSPQIYDNSNQQQTYPGTYYSLPAPTGVVYTSYVAATPIYAPVLPTQGISYTAQAQYSEPAYSPPISPPKSRPEAREIVVTQLPSSMTVSDLKRLLVKQIARCLPRSSTQPPADLLESATIEQHSDGRPKAHAFVVVRSEQIARALVKALDGLQFQKDRKDPKRTLKAHITKEGVPAALPQPTSQSQGSLHQSSVSTELMASQLQQMSLQSTHELEREAVSTTTAKESSTRKSKAGSSDRKKSTSPAVVNGSSSSSGHGRDEKGKKRRS